MGNGAFEELKWRGLVKDNTESVTELLAAGPLKAYNGFDATADSLHVGHMVPLLALARLQKFGHVPIAVAGGGTSMIGDPSGRTAERLLLSREEIEANIAAIKKQLAHFLDFDVKANPALLVNNADWLLNLNLIDFLRDIGKHFPVNRMLDREVVKARLESGISYTEFSYVLLQSLDFLELYRNHGVTLQTGGGDQWGNLAAGVELIRRADGGKAHALATPLLTKADGTKFGKTESGTVWLDPAMTSPYAFHQFFLNAEDAKVVDYLKVFTVRSEEEIADLERQVREEPHLRVAQRALADDITDLVHGVAERQAVTLAAQAIFGRGELRELDAATLGAVMGELHAGEVSGVDGEAVPVTDAMVAAGVVRSKGEAKRSIEEGGAYLNNIKVESVDARITPDDLLAGGYVVVRRGKKTVGGVRVRN